MWSANSGTHSSSWICLLLRYKFIPRARVNGANPPHHQRSYVSGYWSVWILYLTAVIRLHTRGSHFTVKWHSSCWWTSVQNIMLAVWSEQRTLYYISVSWRLLVQKIFNFVCNCKLTPLKIPLQFLKISYEKNFFSCKYCNWYTEKYYVVYRNLCTSAAGLTLLPLTLSASPYAKCRSFSLTWVYDSCCSWYFVWVGEALTCIV
jgi:hypothetical protein